MLWSIAQFRVLFDQSLCTTFKICKRLGACDLPVGLQGHPEFTDKYMEDDLQDRIDSGDLPREVGEAAIRDLRENAVTDEHWADMQKLLKTFLKVDHPSANVYI